MVRPGASPATRKVTVADVARHAGVSPAVVSYVVNSGPRPVAHATAERVRAAIDALGYRPNGSARALRTGFTGILGLVLPETSNPFFGVFADVVHAAATAAGFAVLSANSGGSARTELRLIEDLASRNVDGILVATMMSAADIPPLRHPGLPLVILNCPFPVPGCRTIGPDFAGGAQSATEHLLLRHGHASVAMISGDAGGPDPSYREVGWRAALRAAGRDDGDLVRNSFTRDGGYRAARELLARDARPTAIFASSDQQAFGVLRAAREGGLRVPEDLALAGFDGTADAEFSWPALTTVRQPLTEMAQAAVAALTGPDEPAHSMFGMELIVRQSCGCR